MEEENSNFRAKVRFPMKAKLILYTVLFVGLALGIYISYALNMFYQDKKAYVVGSTVNKSDALAEQVKNVVSSNKARTLSFALLSETNLEQVQELINFDPSFILFSTIDLSTQTEAMRILNEKIGADLKERYGIGAEYLAELPLKDFFFPEKTQSANFGIYSTGDILGLPSIACIIYNELKDKAYLSIIALEDLFALFEKDRVFSSYLLDYAGSPYIQTNLAKEVKASEEDYIKKILYSELNAGSEEVKDREGEAKLVAFSKIPEFNLLVISEISKDMAFQTAKELIKSSGVFGGLIIFCAIFVGILFSVSITTPIRKLLRGTYDISRGEFGKKVDVSAKDELGVLSQSFNFMSEEIRRLIEETASKARIEKEIETARTVQNTLFPEKTFFIPGLSISGHYEPASECGGDWWFYNDMEDKTYFWIGDATGHGVAAALITSAARSAAAIIQKLPDISPAKAMSLLNESIWQSSKGTMYMTFFIACLEKKTMSLRYANASHNPPYLFPFGGDELKIGHVRFLDEVNDPRLGQEIKHEYSEAVIDLKKNDTLFFYTDGLTELENERKEQWGEKRFLKAIIKSVAAANDIDEMMESLLKSVKEFQGKEELKDDITFFTAHFS